MVAAVRAGEISARELLELHLARIDERNRDLNAIVAWTRSGPAREPPRPTRHRASGPRSARSTGCRSRSRTPTRWPGGARRTARPMLGRPRADADELLVERIRRAGAVMIGKTNIPEFAAGSHTFNRSTAPPATRTTCPVRPAAPAGARRRAGLRDGAARRRLRHGWLAAQPGVVLRRGRTAALARPGAGVAALQPVGDPSAAVRWRATSRRGAAPVGDRRPGPSGAARAGHAGSAFAPPLAGFLRGAGGVGASTSVARSRWTPRCARVVEAAGRRSRAGGRRRRRAPDLPRPRTPSGPCARGTSRPGSALCSPSTPTRSSSRWPTTSGPASR